MKDIIYFMYDILPITLSAKADNTFPMLKHKNCVVPLERFTIIVLYYHCSWHLLWSTMVKIGYWERKLLIGGTCRMLNLTASIEEHGTATEFTI